MSIRTTLGFGFPGVLRGALVCVMAVCFSGCGAASVEEGEEVDTMDQAIEGGHFESGYPAVVHTNGCTGSLIAPSVVLTAGHCGVPTYAKFGSSSADFVRHDIDAVIRHPTNDLSIAHLSAPVTDVAVMPINYSAYPPVGSMLTAVGFGRHHPEDGSPMQSGIKRSATVNLYQIVETSDPRLMVRWGDGLSNKGDSGGPLIHNGEIVGVLSSGTEWPCISPTCGRKSYTAVSSWITENLGIAPPAVQGSLYMAQADTLHRVSPLGVNVDVESIPGTTALAALDGALWSIRDGYLHRMDAWTGVTTTHGGYDWSSEGVLMTTHKGYLYILQDADLYQITDPYAGVARRVGTRNWTGATSMVGVDGHGENTIVVIHNSRLYKVNPGTGAATQWGNPEWGGPTSITTLSNGSLSAPKTVIYIQQEAGIWSFSDLSATSYTRLGSTDWTGATAMVGINAWPYTGNRLYVIQNGALHSVDKTTGDYIRHGRIRWHGPMFMTTL